MLEQLIDRLISEGKINKEELDALIEREKSKNPVPALQEENAELWYQAMVNQSKIESNETEVANLWYEVMIG